MPGSHVLIVYAHHESSSFNGAMLREAVETLKKVGHEVVVSDLYAMGFDPVSDRRNFRQIANPARLSQQDEEAYASAHDGYVPSLQAEMDKLAWCDVLILQFPIWWLGMPAILKGWIDRVFAIGRVYGGGRSFDSGVLAGKRALCALTVGGAEQTYSAEGSYAPIETILFPVHRGIFAFTGMTTLMPFVVYGPGKLDEAQRRSELERFCAYLADLDSAPVIANLRAADYENLVRKRGRTPS